MGTSGVQIRTPDLGRKRGRLSDWTTQRWVQATGQSVSWKAYPWIEAPVGDVDVIGMDFFRRFAERQGLRLVTAGEPRGLLVSFSDLAGPLFQAKDVHPTIVDLYEKTSEYDFDVWSEWCGMFRPLGKILAAFFSRRLQQLNVPLSPLDTRFGINSHVLKLQSRDGSVQYSAWVRENIATGRALYVGSYSTCNVPGFDGPCVKVAFPLPNGYALVIMKPESHPDGSFSLRSEGTRFGDPGFYFFVESKPGEGWARYVASFKEKIRVFCDERLVLRADHTLRIWGTTFLQLHYRMRPRG